MIGILPAAGKAERMHGLPKYLLPIPDTYLLQRHVDMMETKVFIGSHPANRASLADYQQGAFVYPAIRHETMTETILSAQEYKWTDGETILFGMPDTFIEDVRCYAKLAAALKDCDVAVGVFHARHEQRRKLCMVDFDPKSYQLFGVSEKPKNTDLTYTWGAIAWKPAFWEYIATEPENISFALPLAASKGLRVRCILMDGGYWDCGTPDEYFDLITHLHRERELVASYKICPRCQGTGWYWTTPSQNGTTEKVKCSCDRGTIK